MEESVAMAPALDIEPLRTPARLSVVIPVYNEAATIAALIERVRAVDIPKQIVVVDDCSKDGTADVLRALPPSDDLVVRFHTVNQGKGAALRTGFTAVTGDVVVVQDADLEYDPHELPELLLPILDGRADAVFGSRFIGGGAHRVLYFWHRVGNGLLTLMSNMLTDLNLTDMETCYKMVRSDVMKRLPLTTNRFGFEPEITARLAQAKVRIYEMAISYSGRTYAEGKKIGWKAGVAAFFHILRFNLFPPRSA